ncbi:MAG: TerC/Alx family metal homeostasis membrane protein [Candidatus Saccharimonadales bacterium]
MIDFFTTFSSESLTHVSYNVPWFMYVAIVGILVLYAIIEAFHGRHDHKIGVREAIKWSVFYISLALLFTIPVYYFISHKAAAEYLAAWSIEKALSLDNLFVFGMIFTAFRVDNKYRRRILNYGITGAIIFRLIFILLGFELLKRFAWVSIIFGIVLLRAAWHAYEHAKNGPHSQKQDFKHSKIWIILNKILPIHHEFDGHKLTTKVDGKKMLTLMAGVIILIELTDIIFAVDSVPAVLAVSPDRYIAYASNIFALLGLRSLFFVYDSVSSKFWAIDWSLALILLWIGVKMVITPLGVHPSIYLSLGLLFSILLVGVLVSLFVEDPHQNANHK